MSNVIAAGAYLRVLRDKQDLSRPQVAEAIRRLLPEEKTTEQTVRRIEVGQGVAGVTLVMAFARVVGANLQEIQALLLDQGATEVDAEIKALNHWKHLQHRLEARVDAALEGAAVDDAMLADAEQFIEEDRAARGRPRRDASS